MIEPVAILCPHCVLTQVAAKSVKDLFAHIAQPLARETELRAEIIVEALLTRERCGSTGFGRGAALPHARMASLEKMTGLIATLEKPLDFAAVDGRPVDVVFALLSPEGAGADHLRALAAIGRLFRDEALLTKLRGTHDAAAAHALLAARGWSEAA